MHPLELKLELALRGARLDPTARDRVARNGAGTLLELALPGQVRVGVPVDEQHGARSPFELTPHGAGLRLGRTDGAGAAGLAVRAIPSPRFAGRLTTRGTPMRRVAHLYGSHLVVHPGSSCGFSVRGTPCPFCLEGARPPGERDAVPVADVVEVVRAAFEEGLSGVVCFNTGSFAGEDGGIAFLAPYIEAVRRHFDTLVAAQVHPPRTNDWIDRSYAMGVDALSYNLEIFDAAALQRHCVGRARYIGRERYLEALAYAAGVFPRGAVWTELVLGLEAPVSTRAGIDALAAMGVVPVVSLVGADAGLAPADAVPVLSHLYRAVKTRGIPMGWVGDLTFGIAPLEARHFAGDGAHLAVAVRALTRSRLGALAARGLARARRRLRVRSLPDAQAAAH